VFYPNVLFTMPGSEALMGLFDFITGDKPTPKNIQKQVTKVKERYSQPEYRRLAMEKLLEWNEPDTLDAVMQRFTVVVQSPHWDENEKRWLVEELVERGESAKEAITRFLRKENHIAFAAKALKQLVNPEDYVSELRDALLARTPAEHRSVQGKQELIACLGEVADKSELDVVGQYLDDHGDDVQCAAIDVIENNKVDSVFDRLTEMVTEEFHSARVVRHAAGAISRLELSIDPEKPLVPAVIEDYMVKDGTLASNR
jgi:hypothetical protein